MPSWQVVAMIDGQVAEHSQRLFSRTQSLAVSGCPLCNDPRGISDDGKCSHCGSVARTRSLSPLVDGVIRPLIAGSGVQELPLLAFAMTEAEERLLDGLFPSVLSVSLFGHYRPGHEVGVDVRDLSRYPAGMASGLFGCLLFDYVPEVEQAFLEAARVLAPGAVLFTHIAPYRLVDGDAAPKVTSTMLPRPGYFEYVPAEGLPSIEVGREWLTATMSGAGFEAQRIAVADGLTGETVDWFVGVRRASEDVAATAIHARVAAGTGRRGSASAHTKTYSISVDSAFGFRRVVLELDVPILPAVAASADFAEHAWSSDPLSRPDEIIACTRGVVAVSRDLGDTWDAIEMPETGDVRLWNSFTTSTGTHLLQGGSPSSDMNPARSDDERAPIFVFDRDWQLVDRVQPGESPWHGSRSIAEAEGAIMYGEYPPNAVPYGSAARQAESAASERDGFLLPSRVLRSRDDGRTWETVLERSWREIRHFHTLMADPYTVGRWWASSGDRAGECKVWESLDGGTQWAERTGDASKVATHPGLTAGGAQSIFRHTDAIVRADEVIWGSDDWLGNPRLLADDVLISQRVGARLVRSRRETPWEPETIGYVGNPVRSLIDVGEAVLVVTEAKQERVGFCPQVMILSRSEPYLLAPLLLVDNFGSRPTGFTYSRASRRAHDGVFFSFRGSRDAFADGARILRWRINFD